MADVIKEAFLFLEGYGLALTNEDTKNYGAYVAFKGNGVRVDLGFDYRDYSFYFYIYKGEDLGYTPFDDGKNIKSFCALAKKYSIDYDCGKLQPVYKQGYQEALVNNVMLLKQYGEQVLKGNEWF